MKKFILGFILGTIIMVIAGQFWGIVPQLNPIASNPFTLWCDQLNNNASGFGKVEATITQNGQKVSDLTLNLSVKKPPHASYPGAKPGEFAMPEKACFAGTNNKGVAVFTKVPVGTAYLFFNNDPAAYPKRFGKPNFSITEIEVKRGQTATTNIELNSKN